MHRCCEIKAALESQANTLSLVVAQLSQSDDMVSTLRTGTRLREAAHRNAQEALEARCSASDQQLQVAKRVCTDLQGRCAELATRAAKVSLSCVQQFAILSVFVYLGKPLGPTISPAFCWDGLVAMSVSLRRDMTIVSVWSASFGSNSTDL